MNTKASHFSPKVCERAVRLMQEYQANYAWWVQRKEIDAGLRPA